MPYSQLLTFQADGATLLQLVAPCGTRRLSTATILSTVGFHQRLDLGLHLRAACDCHLFGTREKCRAPRVIFQQRVFSWSQGDSRQVQGGAISQNAVSGQCTRSPLSGVWWCEGDLSPLSA